MKPGRCYFHSPSVKDEYPDALFPQFITDFLVQRTATVQLPRPILAQSATEESRTATHDAENTFQELDIFALPRPELTTKISEFGNFFASRGRHTSTKLGTQKMMSLLESMHAFITLSGSGNIAGVRGSKAVMTIPDMALEYCKLVHI